MAETGKIRTVIDSFRNLVANLNTDRDKQSHGSYYFSPLTDEVLSVMYRVSWMAKKIVDIPAKDATRRWREWGAEQDQIEAIEAEEKRLKLPQKVYHAIQRARLYGGSAIYFSVKGEDPSTPLNTSTVKKGSIDFITVLPRDVLTPGELNTDPMLPGYGKPMHYEVSSTAAGQVRIDPSRLALFYGSEALEPTISQGVQHGWGDSVLQAAYEAVRNADSTATNIASLVYEAKLDILKIPGLTDQMANPRTRKLLVDRLQLAAQLKSNNGMLIIDGEEEHDQKTFQFAGLPDITHQTLQAVSGAADIPITRFLGQSPAGLNSTGESDLKNYYDSVASLQQQVLTPALLNLDECIIRSALGDRPEEIYYTWSSLWQMSDNERSTISKEVAETIKTLSETGLFPEDELAEASVNMLVEHSIMPGLEFKPPRPEDEPEPDEGGLSDPDTEE